MEVLKKTLSIRWRVGCLRRLDQSVLPVEQGEFQEGQGADCGIEEGAEGPVDVGVVLVQSISDEIEVRQDDLGAGDVGLELQQGVEESSAVSVVSGAINVRDREHEIGKGGGERRC
jgi:hypothetical protein